MLENMLRNLATAEEITKAFKEKMDLTDAQILDCLTRFSKLTLVLKVNGILKDGGVTPAHQMGTMLSAVIVGYHAGVKATLAKN
jgi:hypothetical protein